MDGVLGHVNNVTCECECDEAEFGRHKVMCDRRRNAYWDSTSCRCKSKSVAPRGVELPGEGCLGPLSDLDFRDPNYPHSFLSDESSMSSTITYVGAALMAGTALLMAATTFYYRTKFKQIHKKYYRKKSKRSKKDNDDKGERSRNSILESVKPKKVKKSESFVLSHSANDLELVLCNNIESGGGDLYHEQYNEHGVKIEREPDETELIQKYFQSMQ